MDLTLRPFRHILGLNARTLLYVNPANSRLYTRVADHKLATKRLLQKAAIPTPRLYAKIDSRQQLKHFRWTKLPASFVIKPDNASGGGGVLVIFGRNKKGNWVKADGTEVFIPHLRHHVLDIIDGTFTRGNVSDVALFEQRVKIHTALKPYSVRGIPDIRVLVYNGVPIMAMMRLPTAESAGRANLHAGGIGVGINLVHGLTTTAVYRGRLLETLPIRRLPLSGIRLPAWDDILLVAVRAALASGLNFVGVDVAVDRDDGPLVLELNARPGLEIQFANLAPLRSRLDRVGGLTIRKPERGVALAKNLFSEDIESEIEDLSGRTVLGIEEPVTILDSQGQPHTILAKIDTGAYRTTLNTALARQLNIHTPVVEHKLVRAALGQEERPIIALTLTLRNRALHTRAYLADRSHLNYDMIIGRRDLKGFLVDPAKAPSRPR